MRDGTGVDLASVCPVGVLERAYESGVRRGLTSPDELDAIVARLGARGRNGITRARELQATLVRDGQSNGSDLETRFLQLLRKAGIELPARQWREMRPDGTLAYADYAYETRKVLVELEGFGSHSTIYHHTRDVRRKHDLIVKGWHVIEFTWLQVIRDPDYVIATVRRVLASVSAA